MSGSKKKVKKSHGKKMKTPVKKASLKKGPPKKPPVKATPTNKARPGKPRPEKTPPKKAPLAKARPEKARPEKVKAKKAPTPSAGKPVAPAKKPAPTAKKKPDFRSSFLETLNEKKAEIKEALDRLIRSRKEYNGEHTAGDFIDEVDDAQREISAYSQYSLIERKVRELRKVDLLINRITDEEEFGLCEECGIPIPKERLLAVPDATLCVPCQRDLEKMDQKRSMAARGVAGFGVRKEMDWEGSGGGEEDDNMLIEYHIGSLPAVDIDEAEVEDPPEEKEEK